MKYTIDGFQQEELVRLDLDLVHAQMLRWFVDFQNTGKMKRVHFNDKDYYLVSYDYIIKQLPILRINNKIVIARRFKEMCTAGILSKHIEKNHNGTYTFYRIVEEKYIRLVTIPDKDDVEYADDFENVHIEIVNKQDVEISENDEKKSAHNFKVDADTTLKLSGTKLKSITKDSSTKYDYSISDSISEKAGDDLRKLLFAIFSYEYPRLYQEEKIIYKGKEEGCIKTLVKLVIKHYSDHERVDIINRKCLLLLEIAKQKDKYRDWRFLPSVLLNKWNDLVPGCVRKNTGPGSITNPAERAAMYDAKLKEMRGGKA